SLCVCDDLAEVLCPVLLCINMFTARKSYRACGIDSVSVAVAWRNKTVGRQQDRPVEGGKFFLLLPPCVSVISRKMAVFLECRIIVCRKHFRMCIYIYACAFRLLQQHFQISQIMS